MLLIWRGYYRADRGSAKGNNMRLRNIKGCREVIAASSYVIAPDDPERISFQDSSDWAVKGHWNEVFGNDHPLRIEIGMGKGAFLMELARRNPDVNYVGIEKYSSVLLRAVQKQEKEALPNIRLIRMEAEYITDVFAPEEVDRIYLNFSDPWPKASHAGRRLTSGQFLARYDKILRAGGWIEFKTDNQELFEFSLEEIDAGTWELVAVSHDLHKDPELSHDNVMTEYEARWSAEGKPICYMQVRHRPLT